MWLLWQQVRQESWNEIKGQGECESRALHRFKAQVAVQAADWGSSLGPFDLLVHGYLLCSRWFATLLFLQRGCRGRMLIWLSEWDGLSRSGMRRCVLGFVSKSNAVPVLLSWNVKFLMLHVDFQFMLKLFFALEMKGLKPERLGQSVLQDDSFLLSM